MRTRTGYNEAKVEILDTILKMGEATSHEIALITNKTYENSSILMLQYFRFGLLHRRKIKGSKAFVYSISEKGVKRLEWLTLDESEEDPEKIVDEEEFEEDLEIEYEEIS